MRKPFVALLAPLLLSCGTMTLVNNHDGRGWHQPATGMEYWLAANREQPAGLCRSIRIPHVAVSTTIWEGSDTMPQPACVGPLQDDVREAIQAAGLLPTDLRDPRSGGEPLKVWVVEGVRGLIPCGKVHTDAFHWTTHCTDGSAVIVTRGAGLREHLEAAFKDLLAARFTGER